MRRLVLLLLLGVLVVPAGGAQACDTTQVESLDTRLPKPPARVAPGRTMTVPVEVTRAGQPATDVSVFVVLNGAQFAASRSGTTGADGTVALRVDVPADARGPAELDVQAYRTLVHLPCAAVEEYDRSAHPWGRVG